MGEAATDPTVAATLFNLGIEFTISPSIALSIAEGLFSAFNKAPTAKTIDSLVRLAKWSVENTPENASSLDNLIADVLCTLYALGYWRFNKINGKDQALPQFLVKLGWAKMTEEARSFCAKGYNGILGKVLWRSKNNPKRLDLLKNATSLLYKVVKMQHSLISNKGATMVSLFIIR